MENPGTPKTHIDILLTCPRCGKKSPEFDEQGKHNFCPASDGDKVIDLCMECKMKEVEASFGSMM